MSNEYLTPEEVCAILKISRKTLCSYNIYHPGRAELICFRYSRQKVLYDKQSVYNFAALISAESAANII